MPNQSNLTPKPSLILTPRLLSDTQSLEQAAYGLGWDVIRLPAWRMPQNVTPHHPLVYGEPLFAEVVAASLGLALFQATPDWLATLPERWCLRTVRFASLAEACQLTEPMFVKPADEKSFPAHVYPTGAAIPMTDVLAPNTPVLISEPVTWEVEYRCIISNRSLLTLSPYWRDGESAQAADGSWPAPADEREAALHFMTELLADQSVQLPPALVIDIGQIAGRGWAVIEANSIWGAGIYGCDPAQILTALQQAVVLRSAVLAEDARWVRPAVELEDEQPGVVDTMAADLITLYRPVGQRELELIAESGYRAFPPRLPEQPIFYPVLNERYASEIAQGWNTKDSASGHVGYVTCFQVPHSLLAAYPVQVVGAAYHQELWVPAEELAAFNAAIVGWIMVIAKYEGGA